VLVAQVPRASGRWHQVHFNADISTRFFRVEPGADKQVAVERVDGGGVLHRSVSRPLVWSKTNKNRKIEFDFGDVIDYPANGRPLLMVLELDLRTFRYILLLPDDAGYDSMLSLNLSEESQGKGLPRIITTLDEVEARWPGCPLRSPPVA
jgi:hypothetical protein